jgi:biopolymer transport protein ExbD
MGMTAGGNKGMKSDINITPYIDILLVLLIIFMVVTPVRQMNLRVRAPQPPAPEPTVTPPADVIVVSVGDGAEIAINQIPVEIGALGSRLQEIYRSRSNKNLFISASPTLPYGDIVKVIDISKSAGADNIGLLNAKSR